MLLVGERSECDLVIWSIAQPRQHVKAEEGRHGRECGCECGWECGCECERQRGATVRGKIESLCQHSTLDPKLYRKSFLYSCPTISLAHTIEKTLMFGNPAPQKTLLSPPAQQCLERANSDISQRRSIPQTASSPQLRCLAGSFPLCRYMRSCSVPMQQALDSAAEKDIMPSTHIYPANVGRLGCSQVRTSLLSPLLSPLCFSPFSFLSSWSRSQL